MCSIIPQIKHSYYEFEYDFHNLYIFTERVQATSQLHEKFIKPSTIMMLITMVNRCDPVFARIYFNIKKGRIVTIQ